jgi:hypothetical protein
MEEIFLAYLTEKEQFIDFNGSSYTLLTKENEVVIITDTPQEMFYFIRGYIYSQNESDIIIKNLQEMNEKNIENYEKIIQDMGGEKLEKKEGENNE